MLEILHLSKLAPCPEIDLPKSLFKIDTCQRTIWISPTGLPGAVRGLEAYLFLLRVATGLESEIRGETDVFGQIKESWRLHCERNPEQAAGLRSWMNRLFEDAKAVRAEHLQNLGGSSYGTLTRKLLKSRGSLATDDMVLVVGGGALARAILPHLGTWTRKSGATLFQWTRKSQSEEALLSALALSRHAVFCVPPDDNADRKRAEAWSLGDAAAERTLLHLGYTETAARGSAWERRAGFATLEALFMHRSKSTQDRRLALAARACEERARLRFLSASAGASLSLPHGWEDLLVFT